MILQHASKDEVARLISNEFGASHDVLEILPRTGRLLARLNNNRMAFLATTESGHNGMLREAAILDALEGRLSYEIPLMLQSSGDGSVQLRRMARGTTELEPWFQRIKSETGFLRQCVLRVAAMIAELHQCLSPEEIPESTSREHSWPPSFEWAVERLHRVVEDRQRLDDYLTYLDRYRTVAVADDERVLCHGDFGYHNVVFEPGSYSIRGVFDFDGASFNDPALDLRYLIGDATETDYAWLQEAVDLYNSTTGREIPIERVMFYNAVTAISYIAYRDGVPNEQKWCGRTYSEDLAWADWAMPLGCEP